jgi:hypothetical protein
MASFMDWNSKHNKHSLSQTSVGNNIIIGETKQDQALHSMYQWTITMLTVKIRQPSHEFTFGVGMSFILYPLVLTPVV